LYAQKHKTVQGVEVITSSLCISAVTLSIELSITASKDFRSLSKQFLSVTRAVIVLPHHHYTNIAEHTYHVTIVVQSFQWHDLASILLDHPS
jgi:hypothetical protein